MDAANGDGVQFVPSQSRSLKNAASILVVEDEVLIRAMASEALREAGFQVIEAFNADEAICILLSGVRIDLIFSDVRMPGSMDGLGLLNYAREMVPGLPVILTSGHLLARGAMTKGAAHFFEKPYLFDEVVSVVTRVLNQHERAAVQGPGQCPDGRS